MNSGGLCALDGSVLVLNKFYMAVHVISVRRAFCLLFKELAEVITIDDGQYVAFNFTSWREASQARSRPGRGRLLVWHPLRQPRQARLPRRRRRDGAASPAGDGSGECRAGSGRTDRT